MRVFLNLLICLCEFLLSLGDVNVGVIIQTEDGPVQGKLLLTDGDKEVMLFYGIPYAKPPLGSLRFRKPLPVQPWTKVLNATQPPVSCYQRQPAFFTLIDALKDWIPTTPLSEDCLKLNIFVPNSASPKDNLPVLVFIHGGGFSVGSSTARSNNGVLLAAEGNVIVVTINYRLSSLGFLYLDDPSVSGNAGLYDQLMAIKWIHRNARYFGGDPEQITIAGQSAGAISVGFHLMNPGAKLYFKRAILMSGTQATPWGLSTKENAKKLSLTTASYSGCTGNTAQIIKCLENVEPSELIANEPLKEYGQVVNFQPIIDGSIVPENPIDWLLKKKLPGDIDILTGNVLREGVAFMLTLLPFYYPFQKERDPTVRYEDIPTIVDFLFPDASGIEKNTIQYLYRSGVSKKNLTSVVRASEFLFADFQFTCPVYRLVDAAVEAKNKLYTYLFNHRSSNNKLPSWAGSHHGEDLIYLFGIPLEINSNFTQEEREFSKSFIRFFSNFVKTGNPNQIDTKEKTNPWPQYNKLEQESVVLSPNTSRVSPLPRKQICQFWNKVLPHFVSDLKSIELIK